MKKKKLYRGSMNFSKAELGGSLAINGAGIIMPVDRTKNFKEGFEQSKDWLSFGNRWGSMNDPKFYADLEVRDVMPKPEDFVEVPFRLISATVVGAGSWKATDFTNAAVLKASYKLLEGKPLYKDHEVDLDNWVGLVTGVKWTPAFDSNGVKVPAGIDGIVAIDAKTNPKIARGVLMKSVFSNSVTVEFDWEMSHDFEDEWDFYAMVGSIGSDGKMVRRIVKNIYNYHESSLVWLGADPFAKAYDEDGNLTHIDTGSIYEFAKAGNPKNNLLRDLEKYEEESDEVKNILKQSRRYAINFAIDKNLLPLSKQGKITQLNNGDNSQENTVDMKKFLLAFMAAFGAPLNIPAGHTPTDEEMVEHLKKLQLAGSGDDPNKIALANKLLEKGLGFMQETEATKETFAPVEGMSLLETHTFVKKEDLVTLKADAAKVASLEADAKIGKEYAESKKEEAIRLYKIAVGGEAKADAAVVALIKNADKEAVDGLLKQYTKEATSKFSGTCKGCGSKEISFQSSVPEGGAGEGEEPVEVTEVVTAETLRKQFDKPSITLGRGIVEEK